MNLHTLLGFDGLNDASAINDRRQLVVNVVEPLWVNRFVPCRADFHRLVIVVFRRERVVDSMDKVESRLNNVIVVNTRLVALELLQV